MLEYDGDVNSVDDRGSSPLHCLCSETHATASLPDCVSLLVSQTLLQEINNIASTIIV